MMFTRSFAQASDGRLRQAMRIAPMSVTLPSWFKYRQGKTEPAGENILKLFGPNMNEAYIGVRPADAGRRHSIARSREPLLVISSFRLARTGLTLALRGRTGKSSQLHDVRSSSIGADVSRVRGNQRSHRALRRARERGERVRSRPRAPRARARTRRLEER